MNIVIYKIVRISLFIASIITGWCLAEDFLLPEEQSKILDRKRVSGSALKQEIAELCAQLVEQTSKQIELTAQAQQELYKRVSELTLSDKKAYLNQATRTELQQSLQELKKIKVQLDQEYAKLCKNITFLKRGCKVS